MFRFLSPLPIFWKSINMILQLIKLIWPSIITQVLWGSWRLSNLIKERPSTLCDSGYLSQARHDPAALHHRCLPASRTGKDTGHQACWSQVHLLSYTMEGEVWLLDNVLWPHMDSEWYRHEHTPRGVQNKKVKQVTTSWLCMRYNIYYYSNLLLFQLYFFALHIR